MIKLSGVSKEKLDLMETCCQSVLRKRFSLFFPTAKCFHVSSPAGQGVSCCRWASQLTSFFLQHLFLFGKGERHPESLETSHLLPNSAPFYPPIPHVSHPADFFLLLCNRETEEKLEQPCLQIPNSTI